jgi:predicted ATP-grasp superfamily ATP-dependent carboligase
VLIPTLEVVSKVTNKWTATRIAIENGINCPVSQLLSADQTAEERELVLQRFLFRCPLPWIIKPIRGHGMKGIIQVNSFDAAVKYTCLGSEDLLVQEFIPGSVGSMHLAGLLYNENGKVVRRFSSRSTRTLYPNGGPATAGISVNCPDMIENTETLVSALGVWKGPLNAEWMLDPRDGKLKFIEINPRMWGYGYLATGCGLNFPAGIVSLALGMDIGTDPGFLDGVTLLRSVTDLVFKESPFKLSV